MEPEDRPRARNVNAGGREVEQVTTGRSEKYAGRIQGGCEA